MLKPMKGILYVNIPFARDLIPNDGDTSDPYVEITFPEFNRKTNKVSFL